MEKRAYMNDEHLKRRENMFRNKGYRIKTSEQLERLRELASRQQDGSVFNFELKDKCEVCNSIENLLAHEISYYPLEVITLCASCHSYLHHLCLANKKVRPRH